MRPVLKKGFYRHYKGEIYYVVDVAKHTETEEYVVVYYRATNPTEWFVRPLNMFTEVIENESKVKMPRFTKLSDSEQRKLGVRRIC